MSWEKDYCPGSPVVLEATGAQTYQWSSGHSTAQISLPQIQWPVNLTVTGWDTVGCKDTEMVYIRGIETWDNNSICLVSNDINSNHLQIIWEPEPNVDIQAYRFLVKRTIWTPWIPFLLIWPVFIQIASITQARCSISIVYRLLIPVEGSLNTRIHGEPCDCRPWPGTGCHTELAALCGPFSYSHIQIYRYDDVSGCSL